MKFGLLYLNEIKYDDLAWVFASCNLDADIIDTGISVDSDRHDDVESVVTKLNKNQINIAITMDFCPAVSDACMMCGIKYISWIYDSPQQALFRKQVINPCNYFSLLIKIR